MKITGTNFRVTRRVLKKAGYSQVPSHSLSEKQFIEEWVKPVYKERPFPRFHIIKEFAKIYELHLDKYVKHGKEFELKKHSSSFHQGAIVEAECLKIFNASIKLSKEFHPNKSERNRMLDLMLNQRYKKLLKKYRKDEKGNSNS